LPTQPVSKGLGDTAYLRKALHFFTARMMHALALQMLVGCAVEHDEVGVEPSQTRGQEEEQAGHDNRGKRQRAGQDAVQKR